MYWFIKYQNIKQKHTPLYEITILKKISTKFEAKRTNKRQI